MTNIDARGKNCPIPVIMTKKVIAEGAKEITVLVDNKTATLNLEKLAQNSGMSFSCKAIGNDFEVVLSGEGKAAEIIEALTLDAVGKACPTPVIMAKNALVEGVKELTVLVDNKIAVQNLTKLGENNGKTVTSSEENGVFTVVIAGEGAAKNEIAAATLDATKVNCPIPVCMAKNALKEVKELTMIVDMPIAVENLKKLANNLGKTVAVSEVDGLFHVTLGGEGNPVEETPVGDWCAFVTEKSIGVAPNELGGNLMKMYLYTLTQSENLPGAMLFMNEGVKVLENEEMQLSLAELAIKGVKLIFCGACLNFYGISHLCPPANISNMYVIVEEMGKYNKVVKI